MWTGAPPRWRQYRTVDTLGPGVWRLQGPNGAHVVVKEVHHDQEWRALQRLRHPHVVPLLDYWYTGDSWCLVFPHMPYTLSTWPNEDKARLVEPLLRAVAYLHAQRHVHGDIKPDNVVTDGAHLWLIDLGVTQALPDGASGLWYTRAITTRWYRSPEMLVERLFYGREADLWSLGCTIFELLTGHVLFPGDTRADVMQMIRDTFGVADLNEKISSPARTAAPAWRPEGLDDKSWTLVQALLQINPEHRWTAQQALEFWAPPPPPRPWCICS